MKNELKTLSAKVDEIEADVYGYDEQCIKIYRWNDFLKQNLHLGHFVPTDSEGNVLEEPSDLPKYVNLDNPEQMTKYHAYHAYQAAKDAVLFEGWGLDVMASCNEYYLLRYGIGFELYAYKNGQNLKFVFDGLILSTLNDLAEATKANPIKLKTK